MQPIHRLIATAAALLSGLMILSACQTPAAAPTEPAHSEPAGVPEYIIRATDYAFDAPLEIPAGPAYIRLENEGQEAHHVQLLRLNDGVTLEQFQAALQQGENVALPLVTLTGGVGALDAGGHGRVLLDLAEGQYVLACFLPSPDGVPHLAKGMLTPIKVVKATGETTAEKPTPSVTATLRDFTFDLAGEIRPGKQLWQITNAGPQPHELTLIKLAQGKTLEDLSAFIASPSGAPPFEWMGGMQGLSVGETGWLELDLTPGNYVALCNIPDPASGHAHAELGMIMPFGVREGTAVDASLLETEVDAFEKELTRAILDRNFDQLKRLMSEEFTIGFWLSEGIFLSPDDAIAQLRDNYIGSGTPIAFHVIEDLPGFNAPSILAPDVNLVKAIYVTGWGLEGGDEAVLFIARRADGQVYWHGVLVAAGGFAVDTTDPTFDPIDAFVARLSEALASRDYEALRTLMGERFNTIDWLADGMEYTADDGLAKIREQYLLSDSVVQVHPGADLIKILGGLDAIAFLNRPESKTAKALFATGLGSSGMDEGVVFVAQRADGSLYWSGLLVAAGGFAGQPTPTHPELFTVQESEIASVMAVQDVNMHAGPGDGYDLIGQVFAGQTAKVTGVSVDGNWWRVICPDDTVGNCFIPLGPQVEAVTSN